MATEKPAARPRDVVDVLAALAVLRDADYLTEEELQVERVKVTERWTAAARRKANRP